MNHRVERAIKDHLRATNQMPKKKDVGKIANSGLGRV